MGKIEQYREYIQRLLKKYGDDTGSQNDEVETQVLIDTERDHYQLNCTGWQNGHRIYGSVLHMDIKGEKIWIQHNGTEIGMAGELVEMGVPKDDIVLGFHSPFMRQFSEYAVK